MITSQEDLAKVAHELVAPKKGILAADESTGTMKKRLDAINVSSTPENRSMWREIMANAQGIEEAISGVILYDETLRQPLPSGKMIADLLKSKKIHPRPTRNRLARVDARRPCFRRDDRDRARAYARALFGKAHGRAP